mmetsp:Transcript_6729/g.11988  ORF Transcript_6729/g.11988 Transcript_6729/m.11988 type:complete len:509 (-) Transcript_6729:1214-2740(-)
MERGVRKTKIIATLGRTSSDKETIKAMIAAGMDVARISERFLSRPKEEVLQNLREAIEETGVQIGLMFGLRESDIRIGSLDTEVQHIRVGQEVRIVMNAEYATGDCDLICNYRDFPKLVKPGDQLLIDFGRIIFTVIDVEMGQDFDKSPRIEPRYDEPSLTSDISTAFHSSHSFEELSTLLSVPEQRTSPIHHTQSDFNIVRIKRPFKSKVKCISVLCRAENACIFNAHKPVHILSKEGKDEIDSENRDIEDIKNIQWATANSLDFLVYKQIRNLDDWKELTSFDAGSAHKIVGIQRMDSVNNLDDLVKVADGVLIGRGMLALESSLAEVCSLQKDIVAKCRALGKPVIISTHLLMSMAINKSPTRSEVTDITHAVYDACDALMLSGETAYGLNPVQVIETCSKICIEAEHAIDYNLECALAYETALKPLSIEENLSYCAVLSAINLKAKLIVVTASCSETLRVARFRPACPILAVTSSSAMVRKLNIVRGVYSAMITPDGLADCLKW